MTSNAYCRLISILTFVCFTLLISTGCDEEPPPPPPNLPTILNAKMFCDRVNGIYALTEISILIEDFDGAETILTPYADLLSISFEFEAEPIPSPSVEEQEATIMEQVMELGEDEVDQRVCEFESCKVKYTWSLSDDDEATPILCGDEGDDLEISFRVLDDEGHSALGIVSSQVK